MDIQGFRAAYEEYEQTRKPFNDADTYNRLFQTLNEAAKPEHDFKNVGGYMCDQLTCACGWESRGYFDGFEYAWSEWRMHVADVIGLIPRKCPCGKGYIPIEGGTPCHELTPTKNTK